LSTDDLHTSFQLGKGRRQDRFLEVIDDKIILTSKRSPFRKITFTLNCWTHLMSYLKDIDTTSNTLIMVEMRIMDDVGIPDVKPGRWILHQSPLRITSCRLSNILCTIRLQSFSNSSQYKWNLHPHR